MDMDKGKISPVALVIWEEWDPAQKMKARILNTGSSVGHTVTELAELCRARIIHKALTANADMAVTLFEL